MMFLDKQGPFLGLNKEANDKLSEFWFDEQAEREFMEIAFIVYGECFHMQSNSHVPAIFFLEMPCAQLLQADSSSPR